MYGFVSLFLKSVSEADEDEFDDRPFAVGPRMGVDDGLLPNGDAGTEVGEHVPPKPSRRPSFSFPGYDTPGFVTINGVETQIPDVNAYQHKKTLAQGMMDLALLSANANQLRYVLESYGRHPYYYPSLIFISLSIVFQVSEVQWSKLSDYEYIGLVRYKLSLGTWAYIIFNTSKERSKSNELCTHSWLKVAAEYVGNCRVWRPWYLYSILRNEGIYNL